MAHSTALVAAIALVALATACQAHPQFWAADKAPSCNSLPSKPMKCHKAPQADSATTITVTDAAGKPVTRVCAGGSYNINVKFPEARQSYLTLNNGKVATINSLNKKCVNTMTFSKPTGNPPAAAVSVKGVAPKAGTWDVAVASAKSACDAFMISKTTLPIATC